MSNIGEKNELCLLTIIFCILNMRMCWIDGDVQRNSLKLDILIEKRDGAALSEHYKLAIMYTALNGVLGILLSIYAIYRLFIIN